MRSNSSFFVLHSSLFLVLEVTETCCHHGDAMLVAVVKAQLVLDASARLDDSSDAFVARNLHAIGEGEESVAGHYGSVQVETEALGLLDGLFQRIHTACLTYATGQQLVSLGQDDGVRFGVLHNLVGEEHIVDFLCGRSLDGHYFQVFGSFYLEVAVLYQYAVQQRTELLRGQCALLAGQDDAVLLLTQDFEGIHVIVGSDDDFEEDFRDFLGSSLVDDGVRDEHTTES